MHLNYVRVEILSCIKKKIKKKLFFYFDKRHVPNYYQHVIGNVHVLGIVIPLNKIVFKTYPKLY